MYRPTVPAEAMQESAVLTLLDSPSTRLLSKEELSELAAWVETAKQERHS